MLNKRPCLHCAAILGVTMSDVLKMHILIYFRCQLKVNRLYHTCMYINISDFQKAIIVTFLFHSRFTTKSQEQCLKSESNLTIPTVCKIKYYLNGTGNKATGLTNSDAQLLKRKVGRTHHTLLRGRVLQGFIKLLALIIGFYLESITT